MRRKLLAYSFSLFYFLMSSGVAINAHYCQGVFQEVGLFCSESESCCSVDIETKSCCSNQEIPDGSCCEDELIVLDVVDDFRTGISHEGIEKELNDGVKPYLCEESHSQIVLQESDHNFASFAYPPDKSGLAKWKLYCSPLYYS